MIMLDQNSANTGSWHIGVHSKRLSEVWQCKYRGLHQGVLQLLKCGRSFNTLKKCVLPQQRREGCNYLGVVADKAPIVTGKAKETAKASNRCWEMRFLNKDDLFSISCDSLCQNPKTKASNFKMTKFTFRSLRTKIVRAKESKYFLEVL